MKIGKIEEDVKMPESTKKGKYNFPFADLKVGQSVEVTELDEGKTSDQWKNVVYSQAAKAKEKKIVDDTFKTRVEIREVEGKPVSMRIWRKA